MRELVSTGHEAFLQVSPHLCWAMEIVPGRIPEMLLKQEVGLLRADQRVFEAMLDGWRAQMLARGLSTPYIKSSWPDR